MIADGSALDAGVLNTRLALGLTRAAHGDNKFFGSGGIAGPDRWYASICIKPGRFNALAAAGAEMAAGLELAVGLVTPVLAAGFVALMFVAGWVVDGRNGFLIVSDGWEYNLVLAGCALAVVAIGAGRFSLDYALFENTEIIDGLRGWLALLISAVLGRAGSVGQQANFYRPRDRAGALLIRPQRGRFV